MLKLFVFWGLFALVLTGVVVTLMRNRARRAIERAYARERSAKLAATKVKAEPNTKPHASIKERAASSPANPVAHSAASTAPSEKAPKTEQAANTEKVESAEPAVFDPNATRIHFGASSSDASLAELERDQADLPADSMVKLVCVGGHLKGKSFPVTAAGITVGRDPENVVAITDPRVSSHHAWVGIIDSKVVLRDLGSTNGTFLNAHMSSLVQEVVLSPGDTIFFGGHGGDQFRLVVD
ncbi:MAG: FHA domain-containing protein [Sulfuritalea sp.]|nr:FHA domain-containing protein [Sulfuritalea sp.]